MPVRFLQRSLMLTLRQARRIAIVIIGFTVLLAGLALIVLPGPAFIVIPVGLGILSIEFAWARRWLNRIRTTAEAATRKLRGQSSSMGESP